MLAQNFGRSRVAAYSLSHDTRHSDRIAWCMMSCKHMLVNMFVYVVAPAYAWSLILTGVGICTHCKFKASLHIKLFGAPLNDDVYSISVLLQNSMSTNPYHKLTFV